MSFIVVIMAALAWVYLTYVMLRPEQL